jgi:ABC-type polysaccharide/polyol phosphate transport system ATPase subunit
MCNVILFEHCSATATDADMAKLYASIGIDEKSYAITLKNASLQKTMRDVITAAGVAGGCDAAIGKLLFQFAQNAHGKVSCKTYACTITFPLYF